MKTQFQLIKENKKRMSPDYYIAAFADGTVSDPLDNGCVPPPSEGNYVSIFKTDSDDDIQAKLGALPENKFYNV